MDRNQETLREWKPQGEYSITCQLSRLGRESHACGLKTAISHQLMLTGQILRPDRIMWVVTALPDPIFKNMYTQTKCKKWKLGVEDDTFFFKPKALRVRSHLALIHILMRLGLGKVRAVSSSATVCKIWSEIKPFKVTHAICSITQLQAVSDHFWEHHYSRPLRNWPHQSKTFWSCGN